MTLEGSVKLPSPDLLDQIFTMFVLHPSSESLSLNPCRVFVLADPEVFSGSLAQVVSDDIEAASSGSGVILSPLDHMCNVVRHSIQAVLGEEQCHGGKLAQALKVNSFVRQRLLAHSQFSQALSCSSLCLSLQCVVSCMCCHC